jgi:hypothetical protein
MVVYDGLTDEQPTFQPSAFCCLVQRAGRIGSLDDHRAIAHSGHDTIARWEIRSEYGLPLGEGGYEEMLPVDALLQRSVLDRIGFAQRCPDNSDRSAADSQRAFMCGRIDPFREAAYYRHASLGKLAGKPSCSLSTALSNSSSSYYRNTWRGQDVKMSRQVNQYVLAPRRLAPPEHVQLVGRESSASTTLQQFGKRDVLDLRGRDVSRGAAWPLMSAWS